MLPPLSSLSSRAPVCAREEEHDAGVPFSFFAADVVVSEGRESFTVVRTALHAVPLSPLTSGARVKDGKSHRTRTRAFGCCLLCVERNSVFFEFYSHLWILSLWVTIIVQSSDEEKMTKET